jgi:hypothetical protein
MISTPIWLNVITCARSRGNVRLAVRSGSDTLGVPVALLSAIEFPSVGQLVAVVPVIGVLIALLNVWVSTRNERRRSQPVVIAHGVGSRRFAEKVAAFVPVCD